MTKTKAKRSKTKTKAKRAITKASTSKTSATKSIHPDVGRHPPARARL